MIIAMERLFLQDRGHQFQLDSQAKTNQLSQSRKDHLMDVTDSNGNELTEGDNVTLIKDLKVKGTSLNLKRGTVMKNIRFTSKEGEVECRQGKSTIVLKTQFLKKA